MVPQHQSQLVGVELLRALAEDPPQENVQLVLQMQLLALHVHEPLREVMLLLVEGGDDLPGLGQVTRLGDRVALACHCHTM